MWGFSRDNKEMDEARERSLTGNAESLTLWN